MVLSAEALKRHNRSHSAFVDKEKAEELADGAAEAMIEQVRGRAASKDTDGAGQRTGSARSSSARDARNQDRSSRRMQRYVEGQGGEFRRDATEVVRSAAKKGISLSVDKEERRVMLTASMMDVVCSVRGAQAYTTTDLGVVQRKIEVDGVSGTEVSTYVTTRNRVFVPDGEDVNAATAESVQMAVQGVGDAVANL